MQQFTENFKSINNKYGKIMLEHSLFGKQMWRCQRLEVIEDENRVGLRIQGHEVYMMKKDIISYKQYDDIIMMSDKSLTITIIMNKL